MGYGIQYAHWSLLVAGLSPGEPGSALLPRDADAKSDGGSDMTMDRYYPAGGPPDESDEPLDDDGEDEEDEDEDFWFGHDDDNPDDEDEDDED